MFPRLQNTGSFFEVFFLKVYNFSGATAQRLVSHIECLHVKNEKGIQFGGSAAHQSSFARNGKSDGSDERQLYSQATKLAKKLLTALLC